MAIPEQTLALSDLAGRWNTLYFTRPDSASNFMGGNSVITLDAAGKMTSALDCVQAQPCTPRANVTGTYAVNANGGFDYTNEGVTSRVFAYRAASGDMMFVGLLPGNLGIVVGTKQQALAVPPAGTSSSWDVTVVGSGAASAVEASTSVSSPNADGVSYTSVRKGDGRTIVYTVNKPRDGLRHRPNSNVGESASALIAMPLTGMGLAVYVGETGSFFGVNMRQN